MEELKFVLSEGLVEDKTVYEVFEAMKGKGLVEDKTVEAMKGEVLLKNKTVYEVFKEMKIERFVNQALKRLLEKGGKKAKKEMLDSVLEDYSVCDFSGHYDLAPIFVNSFLTVLCRTTLLLWEDSKYTELQFDNEEAQKFFEETKKDWLDRFCGIWFEEKKVLFKELMSFLDSYYNKGTDDNEDAEDTYYSTNVIFKTLGKEFYKDWLNKRLDCVMKIHEREVADIVSEFTKI